MDPKDAIRFAAAPAGFIRRSDFGSKPDFYFGSATAAFQVEGACGEEYGRGKCIWDQYSEDKKLYEPYTEDAVCHYKKYEEDVKIMKEIGFDSYRFSISWSRILPSGKKDKINEEGIQFYKDLLKKLKEYDIEPFVTLFHFDTPQCLEDEYGGFLDAQIARDFRDFADICFQNFGDEVKHWITINEPWTYAYGGYVKNFFAPGVGDVVDDFLSKLVQPSEAKSIQVLDDFLAKLMQPSVPKSIVDDESSLPCRVSFHTSWQIKSLMKSMAKSLSTGAGPEGEQDEEEDLALDAFTVGGPEGVQDKEDPAQDAFEIGRKIVRRRKVPDVYKVGHNLLLAHAKAVEVYKRKYQRHQKGQIGITLNAPWFVPLTGDDEGKEAAELDKKAAQRALDFKFGWFMDPLFKGKYPDSMTATGRLPDHYMRKHKHLIQGSYDFIGLNYYTCKYVSHKERLGGNYITDQKVHFHVSKDGKEIGEEKGASGWIYGYPRGILDLLAYIKETYGKPDKELPIYVTENGIDDHDDLSATRWKSFCDQKRISYLHDHLSFLLKAKELEKDETKKLEVKGYFIWSFLDNFEWSEGFKARFGIIYVDYDDGGKRYPKLSAKWLKHVLAN